MQKKDFSDLENKYCEYFTLELWDICEIIKKKYIWPVSLIPGIVLLKLLEFDGVFGMRANEVTPGFMLLVGGKYR